MPHFQLLLFINWPTIFFSSPEASNQTSFLWSFQYLKRQDHHSFLYLILLLLQIWVQRNRPSSPFSSALWIEVGFFSTPSEFRYPTWNVFVELFEQFLLFRLWVEISSWRTVFGSWSLQIRKFSLRIWMLLAFCSLNRWPNSLDFLFGVKVNFRVFVLELVFPSLTCLTDVVNEMGFVSLLYMWSLVQQNFDLLLLVLVAETHFNTCVGFWSIWSIDVSVRSADSGNRFWTSFILIWAIVTCLCTLREHTPWLFWKQFSEWPSRSCLRKMILTHLGIKQEHLFVFSSRMPGKEAAELFCFPLFCLMFSRLSISRSNEGPYFSFQVTGLWSMTL